MANPLVALIIGGTIVAIFFLLFRPRRGLYWKWQRVRHNTERVLIEDALKHLYDCEYKKIPCTLQSLSGALSISGEKAARLMHRLEVMGLAKSQGNRLELTDPGRSYALKIIRLHRLWERYLADETGVPEQEWHAQAEAQEHFLTESEGEALAAQMGNPRYDPHGDPIPTESGEIPPHRGIPLQDLPRGEIAEIVHIEDEPEAVYAQLIAQGLHPGMNVQVVDAAPERIHLIADGDEEVYLAPIVAANVTVVPLTEAKPEGEPGGVPLTQLQPGEWGKVVWISRACRGMQRRRLMDLGILPGTFIYVEMKSAAGDPVAYNIRGATIALRKEQTDQIFVERVKEPEGVVV